MIEITIVDNMIAVADTTRRAGGQHTNGPQRGPYMYYYAIGTILSIDTTKPKGQQVTVNEK